MDLPGLVIDAAGESKRVEEFISRLIEERGASGVVLGLSGGIDSSVVAALCVRALSPERVNALLMPERDSSPESIEDAKLHAEKLGIEYSVMDLTPALEKLGCYGSAASDLMKFKGGTRTVVRMFPGLARKGFLTNLEGGGGRQFWEFLAFHRIKHRLRMVTLYHFAEEKNLAVASCANRTEFETGLFVRYGDDSGDMAPVKHLYKTQVFELGRYLGVPDKIVEKKPSPDLFAGLKDEEIMGISYAELDAVLYGLSQGMNDKEIMQSTEVGKKTIEYVKEMKRRSRGLREGPVSLLDK